MSRRPQQRAARPPMTHGVLICSYKRPEDLLSCLAALARQQRRPDDVIVVARESDAATLQVVRTRPDDALPLRLVTVTAPGLICARNAGLDECRTDILTLADDDTIAPSDWLERIFDHFAADPTLGGVGGRDRCHDGEGFDDRQQPTVGRLQWFGRTIGNHHLGCGEAREVDFLKGANMSYRAETFTALRFDLRLRGRGSQPHDDLAFSLAVRRAGWKLVYDPEALLEHYATQRDEPRHYVAAIRLTDPAGYFDNAYNYVIALWPNLSPPRRAIHAVWALLVGMRVLPGLAQAVRLTPSEGAAAWRKFLICQQAHFAAYASFLCRPARKVGTAGLDRVAL